MRDEILSKISKEIKGKINTEPKVLYLLAQIRKFIDRGSENEKGNYPNLYFYSNWVLHVEMNHSPARKILSRFGSLLPDTSNLKTKANAFKEQERNFYHFHDLKNELRNFFDANSLCSEFIDNNRSWFKFKKLLVNILIDCPLTNSVGHVKKFSYEKGEDNVTRFRVCMRKGGSFKISLKEK